MGVIAAVAAAVVLVLVTPVSALACGGGGTSASQIYRECLPNARGGNSQGPGSGGGGGGSANQTPPPVSSPIAKAFAHSHASKAQQQLLTGLLRNPGFGKTRSLQNYPTGNVAAPSTLDAAFDVGPGPVVLIALLAGSAVLLLAATGWRGWRRWRGPLAR